MWICAKSSFSNKLSICFKIMFFCNKLISNDVMAEFHTVNLPWSDRLYIVVMELSLWTIAQPVGKLPISFLFPHLWILLKISAELWRYWPNRMEQPQGTVFIILCFWFELFYFWMSAFRLHETGSKIGKAVSVVKDSLLSNIVKIFHPTSSVHKLVQRFHVSRKVCGVSFSFFSKIVWIVFLTVYM